MTDDTREDVLAITERRHCDHDTCTIVSYDVGLSEYVFDNCELTYGSREDAEKAMVELLTLAKRQLERKT